MQLHRLSMQETAKAIGVGIAAALLLSAIMVPLFRLGVSPLPMPLGLAFAEAVIGVPLPLPIGLVFHLVYATFWAVAYVVLFRDRLSLWRALALALALWVLVLVVFFPVVGWGFFGLAITPKLIPASLIPHLLFGLFVWGLSRAAFGRAARITA